MNRSFRRRKAVWNLTLTIKPHIAFPSVHRVGTPICGISAQFLPGTGTGCSTAAHCLWIVFARLCVNALMGLSCYEQRITGAEESISFNALTGLSCYESEREIYENYKVSMPSRAWVVTARMSNILNFLWYFLCIPAIYKCILAYLPIFFNQLSDFLRCESPNTFLGTCLSHHSFIILLITHGLIPHFYCFNSVKDMEVVNSCVNALSGLYLISTRRLWTVFIYLSQLCQCPLGLIPHFYGWWIVYKCWDRSYVSMPSRAYTSFLRYPFKNLGFIRFTEPVFAGIYQNILTTAVFRAC